MIDRSLPRPLAVLSASILPSVLVASAAAAQVPSTAAGLGYPVVPVDARAAALGSTGIGLLGGTWSLRNPADLTEHPAPGFGLALVTEDVGIEGGERSDDTGRERFSVIRAVVPFGAWAVGLGFGGELDQDWATRFQDTLVLSSGRVPFEEAREHDGGVSSIDLSVARRIGPLSLGAAGQRLTGSVRQTFTRSFDAPLDGAPPLGNVGASQLLGYRGWRFKGGAALTLGRRFMVSGALGVAGELTVEPEDTTVAARELDLPTSVEVGASGRIGDRLLVTAGGGWASWSDLDGLPEVEAHDTSWLGAGIELSGARVLGASMPIRLGARRTELPFSFGDEAVEEVALTGGLGFLFRGGLAEVNLAGELGRRGDLEQAGLEETFRRLTISFSLRQP